jgi:hypothetical protein
MTALAFGAECGALVMLGLLLEPKAESASKDAKAILPVPMAQSWKKCRRVMLGVLGFIL